ncbi:hypothetical protein GCM10010965_32700 [Caldalkalibacillus thermarum]|nr:hypothetical protein GCM10010965_32700 [Caldalkalibacillus thermarum]
MQGLSIPLKCVGEDQFLAEVKDQKEVIRFKRDEQGKIKYIAYHFRQFPVSN